MKDIYVGIFIRDNEIWEVITNTDKDMIIKFMKELSDEMFEENQDRAYVYLNNEQIWNYEEDLDEN